MLAEFIYLLRVLPKEKVLTMAAKSDMTNEEYERLLRAARKH